MKTINITIVEGVGYATTEGGSIIKMVLPEHMHKEDTQLAYCVAKAAHILGFRDNLINFAHGFEDGSIE